MFTRTPVKWTWCAVVLSISTHGMPLVQSYYFVGTNCSNKIQVIVIPNQSLCIIHNLHFDVTSISLSPTWNVSLCFSFSNSPFSCSYTHFLFSRLKPRIYLPVNQTLTLKKKKLQIKIFVHLYSQANSNSMYQAQRWESTKMKVPLQITLSVPKYKNNKKMCLSTCRSRPMEDERCGQCEKVNKSDASAPMET